MTDFNKKLFNNRKSLIIIACVLFLVVAIIIANYLSYLLIPSASNSSSVTKDSFSVYMLSLARSQVKSEAEGRAGDFQSIGGGGYVWEQDDYFYVISSAYANKNDAVLVQNSVKANQGLDSEIIEAKFPALSISGNFSSEEKRVLSMAIDCFYDYYLALYDIAISLDTLVYNETSAKLALNTSHSNLSNTISNFNTLFSDASGQIEEIKNSCEELLSASNSLCQMSSSSSQTYSSLLKYHYTLALDLYLKLAKGL